MGRGQGRPGKGGRGTAFELNTGEMARKSRLPYSIRIYFFDNRGGVIAPT